MVRGVLTTQGDPHRPVSTKQTVALQAGTTGNADDQLRTRRHLDLVGEGLKRLGVQRVVVVGDKDKPPATDLTVTSQLAVERTELSHQVPRYREVPMGTTRSCEPVKDGKQVCRTRTHYHRYLEGYETRTEVHHAYSVDLFWRDRRDQTLLLHHRIDSRDPPCIEDVNFAHLIDYGMDRITLSDTQGQQAFKVELTREQCRG
jgi:hypothetical protein